MWDGKKPRACLFQIFGTPAYVHIPKEKRHKLESKAKLMMFVGYDEQSKAYRMVDKKTGKIEVSRDVRFTEIGNKDQQQNQIKAEVESNDEEVEFIFKGGAVESMQTIAQKDVENDHVESIVDSDSGEESFKDAMDSGQNDASYEQEVTKESGSRRSSRSNKGRPTAR